MNYLRIIIIIFVLLLLSLGVHYLIYIRGYNTGYSYDSMSNSLFVVGVLFFFPALMAQLGSYKLFYGIQYAFRGFFNIEFRRRYKSFSDYLIEKDVNIKSTIFIEFLLSSGTIIAIAILFASLWGRQL